MSLDAAREVLRSQIAEYQSRADELAQQLADAQAQLYRCTAALDALNGRGEVEERRRTSAARDRLRQRIVDLVEQRPGVGSREISHVLVVDRQTILTQIAQLKRAGTIVDEAAGYRLASREAVTL